MFCSFQGRVLHILTQTRHDKLVDQLPLLVWRTDPQASCIIVGAVVLHDAGSRRRPCIVLDELDGAAGGAENHSAVAALVKLLTGNANCSKLGLTGEIRWQL